MKGKTWSTQSTMTPKVSFKNEDKTLFRHVKPNSFINNKPSLQEIVQKVSVRRKMILDRNMIYINYIRNE